MGHLESSVTRLEATGAIACCPKHEFDVGAVMPAFFSPCSDNCGREKSVTVLSAQPASSCLCVSIKSANYVTTTFNAECLRRNTTCFLYFEFRC